MYIFNRVRPFGGQDVMKVMATSVEVAELVNEVTGLDVSVWNVMYHPMGGAIAWSARFESLASYEAMNEKLFASEDYLKLVQKLTTLMPGMSVDTMNQVIAGTLGDKPAKYVTVVQGLAANSHQREAAEWGADLAIKAGKAMDVPTVFAVGAYGNYGALSWISSAEDAASLDDARNKLMADESIQSLVDDGGHLVQPGATQILLRRMN